MRIHAMTRLLLASGLVLAAATAARAQAPAPAPSPEAPAATLPAASDTVKSIIDEGICGPRPVKMVR